MAKQTFTTGQVLTAAQMTSLQQTAMGGGSTTAKTVSYVLTAADAGTVVAMNAAGATTITVNTGLFSAGDVVFIQNWGAGVCTVTAGTATVSTHGSLALSQYEGGYLYFTATGASIFFDISQTSGSSAKVIQVVNSTSATQTTSATNTYVDSTLTASITPTLSTSTILVMINHNGCQKETNDTGLNIRLVRGASTLSTFCISAGDTQDTSRNGFGSVSFAYSDSPATTSATTYKTQIASNSNNATVSVQRNSSVSSITLFEIGA